MSAFVTKNGACIFHEDRLELSRNGIRGDLATLFFGKDNSRHRLSLWVTAFGALAAAIFCLWINNILLLVFFLGFAGYYFFILYKNRDLSTETIIPYSKIHGLSYHSAVEGLSRPWFELHFTDSKGKLRRRQIILPAAGAGGREAAQTAQYLFRQYGIQKNSEL
jgi:hypothetical protein